jgi:hypothetical protein
MGNRAFGMMEQLKYVSTTVTNQNSIHEEIKSRLKSGEVSCRSVQNLVSASLISKNTNIKIYRIIILPVVFMVVKLGLSNTAEERRLEVFENRLLRRIFGPKRDEASGEWRRLHNEERHDHYCTPNVIRVVKSRRMRRARHMTRMGERRGAYRDLVGTLERKIPLGKPRRRWME